MEGGPPAARELKTPKERSSRSASVLPEKDKSLTKAESEMFTFFSFMFTFFSCSFNPLTQPFGDRRRGEGGLLKTPPPYRIAICLSYIGSWGGIIFFGKKLCASTLKD